MGVNTTIWGSIWSITLKQGDAMSFISFNLVLKKVNV